MKEEFPNYSIIEEDIFKEIFDIDNYINYKEKLDSLFSHSRFVPLHES